MHNNSNLKMDEWETDAFLLGARTGGARRLFLMGGSYLRAGDGAVVFDCLSKCNLVLTRVNGNDDVAEVFVQAPADSQVRIGSATVPKRIVMNGEAISPKAVEQRGGFIMFG
jgi:hypothetical protein